MSKVNGQQTDIVIQEVVLLDPSFWQALGKSMGWVKEENYRPHRIGAHSDDWGGSSDEPCDCDIKGDWREQWHELIDHLAEGGTIEGYFAKL